MMNACASKDLHKCLQPELYKRLIASILALAIGLPLGYNAFLTYHRVFKPIVTDFKVNKLEITPQGILASGTLNKREPCELVVTNIYAWHGTDRHLVRSVQPLDTGGQMSTGVQIWGEYKLPPFNTSKEPNEVQVIGVHRCGFFLQETEYGKIKWPPVK